MRPLRRSSVGASRAWVLTVVLATMPVAVSAQQIFMYPTRGQSQEVQDRDRYECHRWAVEQTGFDPDNPPPSQTYYQPPPPPMEAPQGGMFRGGFRGAALGAAGGAIGGNAGEGAAIGAAVGGLFGRFRRREQMQEMQQEQSSYQQQVASVQNRERAALAGQKQAFTRAMKACLQGRGYTVD